MKLEQQIFEIGALIAEGETATYLLPHILKSLLRLRQIEQPAQHTKSLYADAVMAYDNWHKQTMGVRMRYSAAQGKSMKSILAYLLQECSNDEQAALNSWQVILDNWGKLNDFIRNQTDLTQINKNLIEIIIKIKAAASNDKTGAQRAADLDSIISQGR
jgi:hypothetical protein